MIFVFVGTRIPTLQSLAKGGVWQLFDPLLFALLASTVVIPVLLRWAIRRFRDHAGSPPEIEISEIEQFDAWTLRGKPMEPINANLLWMIAGTLSHCQSVPQYD